MLLTRNDIRVEVEADGPDQPGAIAVVGDARFIVGRKKLDLAQLFGELRQNEHVHIPSFGNWSMHDMLAFILSRTGPADVWITSWTITEEPVRLILEHLQKGVIRKLRAVFSERVEAMNPAAHQLARFNMDVRLTKIHAKSIVVINEQWGVTVGGSANFTRNPRIEKYIISTHRAIAEGERTWIDQVFDGADPFAPHG